jgi:hypothetical protein
MQPKEAWRLLMAPLALLFLLASPALAQGVVDQENDPTPTQALGCGDGIGTSTLGQTFVPEADNLVAVALRLKTGTDFTDGTETTMRIFDADGNTVVDDVTVEVDGPADDNGDILVVFEFSQVSVTPGDTYLIQWVAPATSVFTWRASTDDPYPDGNIKSCTGNDWPMDDWDCNFITYAAGDEATTASTGPTCEDRIDQLLEHIDDLGLGKRRARALRRPLILAEKMLEAGRPKPALVLVRVFMMHARYTLWRVSRQERAALLAEAAELAQCIQDTYDLHKRKRTYYRKQGATST